jgi:hypothetical protein
MLFVDVQVSAAEHACMLHIGLSRKGWFIGFLLAMMAEIESVHHVSSSDIDRDADFSSCSKASSLKLKTTP